MDNLIDDLGALKDELNDLKESLQENTPDKVKEIILDRISIWQQSNIETLALKEGDVLPDFCLPDGNGNLVCSVDLRTKGPVVVVFFRGNWCAFCNTTLRMIRKYSPHFKARNATVVAISPLSIEETAKTVKENGLNFHVLSDTNSEYSQLLNIAFVVDDALREVHPDLSELNDDDSFILPIPATYVIETDGRVTYSFIETDFTQRAEPVDILNALPPLKRNRKKTLDEKIQFEVSKFHDRYPQHQMKAMYADIDRLKTANVTSSALQVGSIAPDFKLRSSVGGHLFDSRKLRKHGPLIITFYHGLESPICMLTLETLQRYLPRFEANGATLLAIAPPALPTKRTLSTSRSLPTIAPVSPAKFPLLVDTDNKVAKAFGISNEMLDYFGLHLRERKDEQRMHLPLTATYVVDRSGRIVYSFVDADHTKRAEPRSVLKSIPLERPKYSLKRGPFSFLTNTRLAPRIRKVM